MVLNVRPSFACTAFWPRARICPSLMPSQSTTSAPCEEQLPSPPRACKSQSREGPWSPLCFPGHTRGSLSPGAVSESPPPLSALAQEQRAPSAPSPTALQVSLHELSPSCANPATERDVLPLPASLGAQQDKLYTAIHTPYTPGEPREVWLLYSVSNPIKYFNFYHHFINFICH